MLKSAVMEMTAKEFLDEVGPEEVERVCLEAGTTLSYFYQFTSGQRRPSVDLAKKLVASSGDRLGLVELLESKKAKKAA